MLKTKSFSQERLVMELFSGQSCGQFYRQCLLAVLRKSSDSRLWDALSINKSKNKMHKNQKALRLN